MSSPLPQGPVRQETVFGLSAARPLAVKTVTNLTPLSIEPHMHQELELGVVLAGRIRRTTAGVVAEFGPGDVWLCNSCEVHDCRLVELPCSRVSVMVSPALLPALRYPEAPQVPWALPFLTPPQERPRVSEALRPQVLELGTRLARSVAGGGVADRLQARFAFTELLLTLLRVHQGRRRHADGVTDLHDRIAPALELARTERRMVRSEEAAKACGLSVNGLNLQFRKLMGVTFSDYALRYRFGGAARDLVETGDPIKAVARQWGFTDTSHLHRVFQRFAKCTPAEYRKRPPFPL